MQPTMTNDLNTDQAADVPITRDKLIEQAFCGIIKCDISSQKKNAIKSILLLGDDECLALERILN